MKKIFLLLAVLTASLAVFAQDKPKGIELTASEQQFVKSNSDFAFNLFRKYREDKDLAGQSLVLSPLSITYALGMLNNGATGETQQQINEVLGGAAGSADVINSFCRKMIDASSTLDKKTKVMISDNIYVNEARGYQLLPDFIKSAADYYDATPETRNFFDGKTRHVINQWASDHTEGMIKEPLKEDEFDPMVISYLLNALYFKSEWTQPFDKTLTHKASFDNGNATADMMSQSEQFKYAENDACQSIQLPYGNGAFLMTVFLPRHGKTLDDLMTTLSGDNWDSMAYENYMVDLMLPRFETDTDQRLEEFMKSLGMPRAFDIDDAQFGKFAVNEELPDAVIHIDFMKQVGKIRVNESGTEAAAVTIIGMKDWGAPNMKHAEFKADRPFLYVISEQSTGAIFFMGQYMGITEPEKKNELEKPMLVQGKTWHYIYHHFEEKEFPTGDNYPEDFYDESIYEVSYTVQGDTIIDGRQYKRMFRLDERGNRKYYGAFREDEEGRVWQHDLMGDKKDFMLCDVTCSSYPGPENMPIPDVVNVYGQLLHRYCWNGVIGVEGVGLEGKGLIHYLYGEEPDCICDYESFEMVEGSGIYFTAASFRAPKYIQLTEDEKQLVEKNNDFAFNLFRKARGGKNSVMSPLSITYALGMLNNGAAGQTRQEIGDVLGFGNVDAQNEFCLKMMNELATAGNMDATTKALISNTIFVNQGQGFQLQQDFAHLARHYYQANPQSRNFADGETRGVINQWASDHTEGMIKEVLSEPEFNPQAVSYLLNAIYFKGKWSTPFDKANTKEEPFGGGDNVPMMHNHASLNYAENDLCQTLTLPYGNGTYQMQVFLPLEGKTLNELVASLNGKNWQTRGRNYEVDLKLPRFDTDTELDLRPIMSELGMPSAFDPGKAEFPNFCESDVAENFYIGKMKQVAKLKLDEQGTEAAAVTVIGIETTSMPETATFYANRPFLYTISEQSTGLILFMGQYVGDATVSVPYDVNGDGKTDVADIACVISVMAGEGLLKADNGQQSADVNGDGVVNVADIAAIINAMASETK